MSSDNYELDRQIKELEKQLTGSGGASKIESLENTVQDLERKLFDLDSKIQSNSSY